MDRAEMVGGDIDEPSHPKIVSHRATDSSHPGAVSGVSSGVGTRAQQFSSILIVGAGNFGAATALELARKGDVQVTLVDTAQYPNPQAASHDISKIVRDDYPDSLYMRMMLEAMPKWREDGLYGPYYHEVGMLRADESGFGEESMATSHTLGSLDRSHFITTRDARSRWNGVFATTDFGNLERVLYNPFVGYAEADKALAAVVQAAINHGAIYKIGEMSRLILDSGGHCTGIELVTGKKLSADKILMATGARTSALLVKSAPENSKLHAGSRLVAAGAISFRAKLAGNLKNQFTSTPILKNCLSQVKGESMSILKDGTIKFNYAMCFTNYTACPYTGSRLSVVPEELKHSIWTGPEFIDFFQERARNTIRGLYGDHARKIFIDSYRMCW